MLERKEQRHIYYDEDLKIEAYQLNGIVQRFPNHFHEFYVIGFIEGGKRHLWCKNKEYNLATNDMILFNPRDNHYCAPINSELLDYRALNINPDIMEKAVLEITGSANVLTFVNNVVYQSEISQSIKDVYDAIVENADKMKKEEAFYFLLEQIIQENAAIKKEPIEITGNLQIQKLCDYIEHHYMDNITLDQLVEMTSFGKSYLLRSFTKQVGVSPYRYLQTIRIQKAKHFLEQGMPIIDAAQQAGFCDQSHFSNFFKDFIGITPKQYQRIFFDTREEKKSYE